MSQTLLALELEKAFLLDGQTPVADRFGSPAQIINVLLPNIFAFASLLFFIYIVGAGLKMVMNPDSKKGTEDSKKSITYAITGFLLLFAAYWITQLIQYVTGTNILG